MNTAIPLPARGRTFVVRRRARLADLDATGRVRLDAVARFLQDTAIDDVQETGWGAPVHLWFVRKIVIDVIVPLLEDRELEIVTWCSGVAALAAGRRWTVTGDQGGRLEVDSVWIHLDAAERPARIEGFEPYREATEGRSVVTRLELSDPAADAAVVPWPLRMTDVDLHGHVNNAVYWQAVEDRLALGPVDMTEPHHAALDYREPLELDERLELRESWSGSTLELGFVAAGRMKAVARVRNEQRSR